MKRTLIAVGIAVILSLMFVPHGANAAWNGARLNEDIVLWIQRKFPMAAKLSFMMRSVWL